MFLTNCLAIQQFLMDYLRKKYLETRPRGRNQLFENRFLEAGGNGEPDPVTGAQHRHL